GASVVLKVRSPVGAETRTAGTGLDHRVTFEGLNAGDIHVHATHPVTGLRGAANGVLSLEGELLRIVIQLEDTGSITGRVLQSDGVTPAAEALVYLQFPGGNLLDQTETDGTFTFEAVRMGNFEIEIQEALDLGRYNLRGTLSSNGEVIDFGDIVLDDEDPRVLGFEPGSGTTGLALDTTFVVRFSEPMAPSTFNIRDFVWMRKSSGNAVHISEHNWFDNDTAVELVPSVLVSGTAYEVVLEEGMLDVAGRAIQDRVVAAFTTADVIPPVVIDGYPLDGTNQVPIDANLLLVFSEPIVETSLSGSAIQLYDLTDGTGVGTTFQVRPGEREVVITPIGSLIADHQYQLTVQGAIDLSGLPMAAPHVATFWTPDETLPTGTWVSPAAGATFTSGDLINAAVTADDNRGVARVEFRLGDYVLVDETAPYAFDVPALPVTVVGDHTLTARIVDLFDNSTDLDRTVHVQPLGVSDPPAMRVDCLADQDRVRANWQVEMPFVLSDDLGLERWVLTVDGEVIESSLPFETMPPQSKLRWVVPADALPGTVYRVVVEARDFSANVVRYEVDVVLAETLLTPSQVIDSSFDGQYISLHNGTYTIDGPIAPAGIFLIDHATLEPVAGQTLQIDATERIHVQCGGTLDASEQGFAGAVGSDSHAGAPSWVSGSTADAGGSHGSHGIPYDDAGTPGDVYGSVYRPLLPGGGGAQPSPATGDGDAGGGVVHLRAPEVSIDGAVLANGRKGQPGAGGAGGSIFIEATTHLRGVGRLEAIGGNHKTCSGLPPAEAGGGGGGRIGIDVTALDGFDPGSQAKASGGRIICGAGAGSGTVYAYVDDGSMTHGVLWLDGDGHDSIDVTHLPTLAGDVVSLFEIAGADAWITAPQVFRPRWDGAYVELFDGADGSLGVFKIAEIDGAGRIRALGAGGVTGATRYEGRHRFDRVELLGDASLVDNGAVELGEITLTAGDIELDGPVRATTIRVESGATVRSTTGVVSLIASGDLIIEPGAVIDVDGAGHLGGVAPTGVGGVPAGVIGSAPDAGGSHGGGGSLGDTATAAGETYDSIVRPRLAGGGGGLRTADATNGPAGNGGGVVYLEVGGTLTLDGTINSRGDDGHAAIGGGGAGGSVWIDATTLAGSGTIDAHGGDGVACPSGDDGAGGGGRVALHVDTLSGFDPATQVVAWGGMDLCGSNLTLHHVAGAGTVFVRTATDTHGTLRLIGKPADVTAKFVLPTALPTLDEGMVSLLEASGGDAWLSAASPFAPRWDGVWVDLYDVAGVSLGSFEVDQIDGNGRLRLVGAGAVNGAVTYRGGYRFDRIDTEREASVLARSPLVVDLDLSHEVTLGGTIDASSLIVRDGGVLRAPRGETLELRVDQVTVETGGAIRVDHTGYMDPISAVHDGLAPSWVAPATQNAGGSHGGQGSAFDVPGASGDVFGSVYWPSLGGGAGGSGATSSGDSAGGGLLLIEATTLTLDGELSARGEDPTFSFRGAGSGGTVRIATSVFDGTGVIDASGGHSSHGGGAGGGGRVAVSMSSGTFDVEQQARAYGGDEVDVYDGFMGTAAAGTVWFETPASTHGTLIIGNGLDDQGQPRTGLATRLPTLGSGTVSASEDAGADLWISAAAGFTPRWRGVGVELIDAGSQSLGVFEAIDRDETGRIRLAGAATLSPATYTGRYRFDTVVLQPGALLESDDPVDTGTTVFEGLVEVSEPIVAANALVKSGAVVRPAAGTELVWRISGTLEIEAGALIDVSGFGYAEGLAPSGITTPVGRGGGSHGGIGSSSGNEVAGDIFGSVTMPFQGGGGPGLTFNDAAGGGVLDIEATEVIVRGEIRARGTGYQGTGAGSGGAGGSVRIAAARIDTTGGLIDASGGDHVRDSCPSTSQSGGGGRVALAATESLITDPLNELRAWGGERTCGSTALDFAAPGTIFLRDPTATHGELWIDQGGTARSGWAARLPALGSGALTPPTVDGADLWVERGDATAWLGRWLGAWMTLTDAAGADLGTFRVVELDSAQGVRLAGAAAATTATTFTGQHRFDDLVLRRGAVLELSTGGPIPTVSVERKLDIDGDSRLDASGLGYAGGEVGHEDGYAPAPVSTSDVDAGGSHGGLGALGDQLGAVGEVYDSVYQPWLAGAGGARDDLANPTQTYDYGSPGGGVLIFALDEVQLDGEIRVRGFDASDSHDGSAGAGGTLVIDAQTLRGSGVIDVSGGGRSTCGVYEKGAGGGGRVVLDLDTFDGFDVLSQVRARGGIDCASVERQAGAGTVLWYDSASTHGHLVVDQRLLDGTTVNPSVFRATTPLPSIGRGTVVSTDTEPTDASALWIEASTTLDYGVVGMWVRISATDYRVLAEREDRQWLLLDGAAGAVVAGDSYVGIYAFDSVTLRGGAEVVLGDGDQVGSFDIDAASTWSLFDITPPVIADVQPADGSVHPSGSPVVITATVSDNVSVTSVTLDAFGQTLVDTEAPYTWTLNAPTVSSSTSMPLVVTAVDDNSNPSTFTRNITVDPTIPGLPPEIAVNCLSSGLRLAPDTGIDLDLTVSDPDDDLDRVELYFDSELTPSAVATAAPWDLRLDVPANRVDGDVLTVTLVARDFSGLEASVSFTVDVIAAAVFAVDTTIADGDTTYDGGSVVVTGGTLTLDGSHGFRDLVVLGGATVTHTATDASAEQRLDLSLTRDLVVACGGRIDVTERGYLGTTSGTGAYGYGNTTDEGAELVSGGSHGGLGGAHDGGGVYGSLFDPATPGGGGAGGAYSHGGGVIRIAAAGDAVIDGAIHAVGGAADTYGHHGAGGSIRLDATTIRGLGEIDASGSGSPTGTAAAGGGGGRVALYGSTIDADLLTRTRAAGGSTISVSKTGAAGTIFVKRDSDPLGVLIVDNLGRTSDQYTLLPKVGSGTVSTVETEAITDTRADFRHSLVGAEVAFNGDLTNLWPIASHDHHGQRLVLDVSGQALSAQVGDSYAGRYRFDRVEVRNGARLLVFDPVDSTQTPVVDADALYTPAYTPTVAITAPVSATSFDAGAAIAVTADVDSPLGIVSASVEFGGNEQTLTAAPWSWTVNAPAVSVTTTMSIVLEMVDGAGNVFHDQVDVQIEPIFDPTAPMVTLAGCPADGDWVVPDANLTIPFTITDNDSIERYELWVDGVLTDSVLGVAQAEVSSSFSWTVPTSATGGDSFDLEVKAWDYGGASGAAAIQVSVPVASWTTGPATLESSSADGLDLLLGPGVFTLSEAIAPASIRLLDGASLVPAAGIDLDLTVTGELRVQCGASVDATGHGYAGASGSNIAPGDAPAWVAPAPYSAGGSHGGVGSYGHEYMNSRGDVYGSVYRPSLGGGGGSSRYANNPGGAGGGVLRIDAASIVLDGTLSARGESRDQKAVGAHNRASGGAGGSVDIRATSFDGVGVIDVRGGDYQANHNTDHAGAGGGGRVALDVVGLGGFDVAEQVRIAGGRTWNKNGELHNIGGSGTLWVHRTGDVHGSLHLDAEAIAGAVAPPTALPTLGSGTVSLLEASGDDLWVTTVETLHPRWLGVAMQLVDSGSGDLGTYVVAEIDAGGRARLLDASNVTTAVSFVGRYRFDAVYLRDGAGLDAIDELDATAFHAFGEVSLPSPLEVTDLTIAEGAVLRSAASGPWLMTASGTLTLAAGATIDVDQGGYVGGSGSSWSPGEAPAWVTAAPYSAGGSYGGVGSNGHEHDNGVGDTYDSVFQPILGGAGGSTRFPANIGGAGGGALVIDAATLVLDGTITARGESRSPTVHYAQNLASGGAGGAVSIIAGHLSGTGSIDVRGGDYQANHNSNHAGAGGGGRVAIDMTTGTFDATTQVLASGGRAWNNSDELLKVAGAGTVLVRQGAETYGALYVNAGVTDGTPVPPTPLPLLGGGSVTAVEVSGSDLWVTTVETLHSRWLGVVMMLSDDGGGVLGDFRVVELDGGGRARLAGASTATAAT
ncbi:MAG: Ig-like domain-containing protein, partial [Acidobacteriota bacterium]